MPPPPMRKCSKDCPSKNTNPDLTWNCFRCQEPIHLLCYGVVKTPEDIFIIDNIKMVCDECLAAPRENLSPKRKQPFLAGNLVQSVLDFPNTTMSFSKPVTPASTPSKASTVKLSQQFQTVIEALVQKVETQTSTIVDLKSSIETMNGTVKQQTVAIGDSNKINGENLTSIKESLSQMRNQKFSYANVAKEGVKKDMANETPKSYRPKQTPKSNKPVNIGKSTNMIGKPISPVKPKQTTRPKPEKAVWISRIHRDTTEEELSTYIKESIGAAPTDFDVRKLVKKDRDITEYSFVSFRIACRQADFHKLMDPMYWPSNS